MKISQLAQATTVNDDDVFPVVQNGETKKVKRKDILVQSDMNENDENSPAFIKNKPDWSKFQTEPCAKAITYNKDLLKYEFSKPYGPMEGGGYGVNITVRIPVLEYSVVSGELVTKDLVSDYRPVSMCLNKTGAPRIAPYDHCLDVSEFFYTIQTSGDLGWVSYSDIEKTLLSLGCTKIVRSVSASREEYSNTSGTGRLAYIYSAYFEDKATLDVVTSQLIEPFFGNIQFFATDFIVMTEKEAEVINNA